MSQEKNSNTNKNTKANKKETPDMIAQFLKRFNEDKKFATIVYGCGAAVVVIIIILCIVLSGGKDEPKKKTEKKQKAETETTVDMETAEVSLTGEKTKTFVDDGSLQENVYEDVNNLVKTYFDAQASGNRDTIASLKSDTTEEELIKIEKKSAYIDAFENLTVYTKLGEAENSYIAFVYYDIHFTGIDTVAPGLTTLYVCQNDAGELHIYDGDLDEATSARIKEAASEDDVVELFNRVEVAYNGAIEADANLKTFMDELPTKLDTEVAQALKDAGTQEEPQPEEEQTEEVAAIPATTETVQATDTVNVRSSDSENADKLGKLDVGTQVTRYESKENGWSRIDYNGQEGYVKSEYLSVVSTQEVTEEAAEAPAENTESADQTVASGKVNVKETVNVRKSASESAEKIGVAYQGENYDLVMKQADGWSKIKFNGEVGFVKSEFLNFE